MDAFLARRDWLSQIDPAAAHFLDGAYSAPRSDMPTRDTRSDPMMNAESPIGRLAARLGFASVPLEVPQRELAPDGCCGTPSPPSPGRPRHSRPGFGNRRGRAAAGGQGRLG